MFVQCCDGLTQSTYELQSVYMLTPMIPKAFLEAATKTPSIGILHGQDEQIVALPPGAVQIAYLQYVRTVSDMLVYGDLMPEAQRIRPFP